RFYGSPRTLQLDLVSWSWFRLQDQRQLGALCLFRANQEAQNNAHLHKGPRGSQPSTELLSVNFQRCPIQLCYPIAHADGRRTTKRNGAVCRKSHYLAPNPSKGKSSHLNPSESLLHQR